MQLSEDEKQKRLQALKELLSEEEAKTSKEDEKEEDDKAEEEGEDKKEDDEDKKDMKEESYKQHYDAMFDGTELSEESKQKLKVLFEAAVGFEVEAKLAQVKAQLDEEMKSALSAKEAELKEEADAYLSYVVEEWTSKNEVALKQQVKLDIMESFVGGLRGLFMEHNINIPEEQTNMVDDLMEKVAGLEDDVKALAKKNVTVSEELDSANRKLAFKEITEGMTTLDVEKLKALVESKEFDSAEDFTKGVSLIKESYFKKEASVSEDQKEEIISEAKEEIPASIQAYASMITRVSKK